MGRNSTATASGQKGSHRSRRSPQFTTLVSLLKKAGLVRSLERGTYTVFAPRNAAFSPRFFSDTITDPRRRSAHPLSTAQQVRLAA